jgi:hypothetical protein
MEVIRGRERDCRQEVRGAVERGRSRPTRRVDPQRQSLSLRGGKRVELALEKRIEARPRSTPGCESVRSCGSAVVHKCNCEPGRSHEDRSHSRSIRGASERLSRRTPNSRAHEETARDVLKAIGLPLAPVVLNRYEAYKLASLRGLTAQEIDPGSNAATEIEGLWNWLCAELHLGTLALVHKGAA